MTFSSPSRDGEEMLIKGQDYADPGSRARLLSANIDGVLGHSLATAVPSVAGWTQTGLPKALDGR